MITIQWKTHLMTFTVGFRKIENGANRHRKPITNPPNMSASALPDIVTTRTNIGIRRDGIDTSDAKFFLPVM